MTTMYDFDLALAPVLANHLAMRDLTAADLATAIGVPTSTVENWLAVRAPLTVTDLARVSVALGVMPSVLVSEAEAHRASAGGAL